MKKYFVNVIHAHQFQSTGENSTNIQKHFRSQRDSCFPPQAISAFLHVNGGLGYENFMPCLVALSY